MSHRRNVGTDFDWSREVLLNVRRRKNVKTNGCGWQWNWPLTNCADEYGSFGLELNFGAVRHLNSLKERAASGLALAAIFMSRTFFPSRIGLISITGDIETFVAWPSPFLYPSQLDRTSYVRGTEVRTVDGLVVEEWCFSVVLGMPSSRLHDVCSTQRCPLKPKHFGPKGTCGFLMILPPPARDFIHTLEPCRRREDMIAHHRLEDNRASLRKPSLQCHRCSHTERIVRSGRTVMRTTEETGWTFNVNDRVACEDTRGQCGVFHGTPFFNWQECYSAWNGTPLIASTNSETATWFLCVRFSDHGAPTDQRPPGLH
ncbi:hypothetical protein FQR65_LT20561 [Abscondita terminalis]|nr:hypothetical protein FQR65_LT20561 [Abscondita terminalis]